MVLMIKDVRRFDAVDPFGRTWKVIFLWHQNGISIRHADTVDVKFQVHSGDEHLEKVIALNHPDLLKLSQASGHPLTDTWCMKLAALHLKTMIETWEDMEKTLITLSYRNLERHNTALQQPATIEE
jgi:hypothetical protein